MPGIKNTSYKGFNAGHASGSSEGGWMLWSGSFFFTNSAGTRTDYSGVGIEAIGNSESYLRFSSSNGGALDVRANKFFIGNPDIQFISGSNSQIEISSSGLHIRPTSATTTEITASAGRIGNWEIKDGKLSGSNATLDAVGAALYMSDKGPDTDSSAAFDILRDEYYIDFTPNDQGNTTDYFVKFGPNFAVDKSGSLHASGAVFEGTITASAGHIGGWVIGTTALSSSNYGGPSGTGIMLDGQAGTPQILIKRDSDNFIKMHYTNANDNGFIAHTNGFDALQLGSTNKIAGWEILAGAITASNIHIGANGTIQTEDFTSSIQPASAGRGWRIKSTGEAEFENATIRGTLNTAVFEKQSINVVGGQLLVSNGTTITSSAGSLIYSASDGSSSAVPVANASGFVVGEYLIAKATGSTGFTTETMRIYAVDSTSKPNTLSLERGKGGGLTIPTMSAGQVFASAGVSGSGYIHMNASPADTSTPYIDIIERTGSNSESIARKLRLGDLSGVAGEGPVSATPGFGLYSENVFLSGTITASAGKIANWHMNGSRLGSQGGQIVMDSSTDPSITVSGPTSPAQNQVVIHSAAAGTWGITGKVGNNDIFELGDTNQIAGWDFDDTTIAKNNVTMSSAGIIYAGNPAAQRIEINGSQASMSFFDSSGTVVMTIDDNIADSMPGISMTEGAIIITGSTDFGDGATLAPAAIMAKMTNVTAVSAAGIQDSRVGAIFALSDGASVNTDYSDFTTTFIDTCGTKGGGGGGGCYDVGAIVGSVHNAQNTGAMYSGYGHDAYGIISRAIVADPSKNQQWSFFGEHGYLVNSQSAVIGGIFEPSDWGTMLTVYEPAGGDGKGISLVSGDSSGVFLHCMNSTTGDTPNTDGWRIGIDSSERFGIANEEQNRYALLINDPDNEVWIGGRVTIGRDAIGTTTTLPFNLDEADTGTDGAASLIVKSDVNQEVAVIAAIGHDYQSSGLVFVGQNTNYGGGIAYEGGDSGHVAELNNLTGEKVHLYRVDNNTVEEVIYWGYGSSEVSVIGDVTDGVSDERLKENIRTIDSPIDKLKKIRGVYFDYNKMAGEAGFMSKQDFSIGRNKGNIGVIAQEVEKVLPEVVKPAPCDGKWKSVEEDGREQYKTVDYEKIVPLLIEGIKDQQKEIEELKNKVEEIKKCIPGK